MKTQKSKTVKQLNVSSIKNKITRMMNKEERKMQDLFLDKIGGRLRDDDEAEMHDHAVRSEMLEEVLKKCF